MKKWYMSKTLWVNALMIVGMVAEYFIAEKIYSPEVHAIVIAVINLGLRIVTKSGLMR